MKYIDAKCAMALHQGNTVLRQTVLQNLTHMYGYHLRVAFHYNMKLKMISLVMWGNIWDNTSHFNSISCTFCCGIFYVLEFVQTDTMKSCLIKTFGNASYYGSYVCCKLFSCCLKPSTLGSCWSLYTVDPCSTIIV